MGPMRRGETARTNVVLFLCVAGILIICLTVEQQLDQGAASAVPQEAVLFATQSPGNKRNFGIPPKNKPEQRSGVEKGSPKQHAVGVKPLSPHVPNTQPRADRTAAVDRGSGSAVDVVPVVAVLSMGPKLSEAWRTSSKRLTFPAELEVGMSSAGKYTSACSVTFYGKSSLKLKYTSRRSVQVQTAEPFSPPGSVAPMRNFLLLSLWEDTHRVAYRTAAQLLEGMGLFFCYSRLIELRCVDPHSDLCGVGTLGVYLLLEYPTDCIERRAASQRRIAPAMAEYRQCLADQGTPEWARPSTVVGSGGKLEVGNRNWFYFEKPKNYDLLHVPSFKRNSTLSKAYRIAETDPVAAVKSIGFDYGLYLLWVATNTVLRNGDYDDEVFFFGELRRDGSTALLRPMAWDYDSIFSPCHRDGKQAVPSNVVYCGETPLERRIIHDPTHAAAYKQVLRCGLATVLHPSAWSARIANSGAELAAALRDEMAVKVTFGKLVDFNSGVGTVRDAFAAEHKKLTSLVGVPQSPTTEAAADEAGGDAEVTTAESAEKDEPSTPEPSVNDAGCAELRSALSKALRPEYKQKASVTFDGLPKSVHLLALLPDFQTKKVLSGSYDTTEGGLYCVKATSGSCSNGVYHPFVVRSKERGKAEFGIPKYDKVPLGDQDFREISSDVDVTLHAPRRVPAGSAVPIVARAVGSSGSWARSNILLPTEGGSGIHVVRGFSGFMLKGSKGQAAEHIDELVGSDTMFSGAAANVKIPVAARVDVDESAGDALGEDHTPNCVIYLRKSQVIARGSRVVIPEGCVVVLAAGITVTVHGTLTMGGTRANPVLLQAASVDKPWKTIHVSGKGAKLTSVWAFFVSAGGGERTRGTGHHHTHAAFVTADHGASATMRNSFLLGGKGPCYAAGSKASLVITDSLCQWAQLGAECVECDFASFGSVWTHFPSADLDYEDEDNDGLYLSGGEHRVHHSVIAHTKDDGIDTGMPDGAGGDGGTLTVENTIIEDVQHEGIALSGSPRGTRRVDIKHTVIQRAQQGIESGYAGSRHTATVSDSVISRCTIGARYGDNYHSREQSGTLTISSVVFERNTRDLMNWVRSKKGGQNRDKFVVRSATLSSPELGAFDCRSTEFEGDGNTVSRSADKEVAEQKISDMAEHMFA